MKYFFASVICLFLFSALNAQNDPFKMPPKVFPILKDNYPSANSDEIFTVGKVTGDIGKAEALYLPKPFYPGAAKQDSAEGKIYVSIAIDEKGNVASARSTDGHPALRKVAEETALASKFRAAKFDDQPAKSEGWLIYNFEIAKPNWIKAAYDLALLHSPFTNQKIALTGIRKNFKPDWTAEIEMLSKLEEFTAQMPKIKRPIISRPNDEVIIKDNVAVIVKKSVAIPLPVIPEPSPEQIAVMQNLVNALHSRLASDEIASWQFNLAFAILTEAFPPRYGQEYSTSTATLKTFLQNAPPNLPNEYKTELADLINLIETDAKHENFDKIQSSIVRLQKLK